MRKLCEVCKGIGTITIGIEFEKCQNCDGERWVGLPDKPMSEGQRQSKDLEQLTRKMFMVSHGFNNGIF